MPNHPPFWKTFSAITIIAAFWAFDYKAAKTLSLYKPMELPYILSGTFGELRGSHFHMGIDIKTLGREGFPVQSIEAGYVSRIKISPYGYGKAVYIDHPNKLTSVYAHLSDLSPRIKKAAYELMRENKNNELDHYFEAGALPLKAKELIGYSGNSGGSMGPHLHFELRESALQIPVNPLHFNYSIEDKEAPQINALYLYNLENTSGIEFPKRIPNCDGDTLQINSSILGVAVSAFDRQDGNYNKNGVYSVKLSLNDRVIFEMTMDKISYSESRYIQAHSDPLIKEKHRESVHRCFILPGDALSIYNVAENYGKITLENQQLYKFNLELKDYNKNTTTREWWVQKNDTLAFFSEIEDSAKGKMPVTHAQKFDYESKQWTINIPAKAFYYDTYIFIEESDSTEEGHLCNKLKIASPHRETHRLFSISLTPDQKIDQPDKAVIVREENGNRSYLTTHYKDKTWSTRSRSFGTYYLVSDTTIPEFIKMEKVAKEKKVIFYAKDSQSGITDYHAYINGEWSICYYDAKNNAFEIECRSCFEQSGTELVLNLSDEKRNILSIKEKF
ncbi:MAG: M23 family metallopeptidase [Chitinophagales bacterium]